MKHCTLSLISLAATLMILSARVNSQTFFEQLPGPAGGHIYAVECNVDGDPVCLSQTGIFKWNRSVGSWQIAQRFWTDVNNKKLYRAPGGKLFACLVTALLYASDDGGVSWYKVDGVTTYSRDITANSSGNLFNAGNGVLMSSDGGTTWIERSNGVESEYLHSIVAHPNGSLFVSAPLTGIFRSSNEGQTWSLLQDSPTYIFDLFVTSDGVLWGGGNQGAYSSTDQGTTWVLSSAPTSIRSIAQHPSGDLFICTGGAEGIYRSTDDGGSWTAMDMSGARVGGECISFNASGRGFAASTTGVFTSTDGVEAWQPRNAGLLAGRILAMAELPNGELLVDLESVGLHRSTDHGQSWQWIDEGISIYTIHTLLVRDDRIYAASSDWLYSSTDGGMTWVRLNSNAQFETCYDVLMDNEGAIYIAKQNGIMFSSDGGAHWETRDDGLSGSTMLGIAMLTDGTLFGACSTNGVFRSTDAGQHWAKSGDFPEGFRACCVATDSRNALYVGTLGNGMYRSEDKGMHFERVSRGLDNRHAKALIIAEDDAVFCGTNTGVFFLASGTDTWVKLSGIDHEAAALMRDSRSHLFAGTASEALYVSRAPVSSASSPAPIMISPANGASETGRTVPFSWQLEAYAMYYRLQLSMLPDLSSLDIDTTFSAASTLTLYSLTLPAKYYWRMSAGNTSGESAWSPIWSFNTGQVTDLAALEIPSFHLEQNFPNPSVKETIIRFSTDIPTTGNLSVYSALGRKVATLFDGHLQSGRHEVSFKTATLAAGVYLYRLTTARGSLTRRCVVVDQR
ncbi:MAG: T9SS type A sorting domain-containing protein [Bacteroidetes bacterium]|nr:T9SS type A sorting domain-containing protein [Bacteroidota bacterium]